ncbi:MAG: energy transducer TonB [Opitutales bacterium]|nr:energy transducer TonB [Opitutales bacterium]
MNCFKLISLFLLLGAVAWATPEKSVSPEADTLVRPVLIAGSMPAYPETGRVLGIQGVVLLEALISDKGEVIQVEVARSLHPEMDRAALQSVRDWKFEPARRDGEAIFVTARIPIRFVLVPTRNLPTPSVAAL